MENPIKMDDLGVPLFSETSIYTLENRWRATPMYWLIMSWLLTFRDILGVASHLLLRWSISNWADDNHIVHDDDDDGGGGDDDGGGGDGGDDDDDDYDEDDDDYDDDDDDDDDDDVDVCTTHWLLHIVIYKIYIRIYIYTYCCIMLSVRLRFLGPWPWETTVSSVLTQWRWIFPPAALQFFWSTHVSW